MGQQFVVSSDADGLSLIDNQDFIGFLGGADLLLDGDEARLVSFLFSDDIVVSAVPLISLATAFVLAAP